MMARLRAVALKEMEQKLRAILMKRKKNFFFLLCSPNCISESKGSLLALCVSVAG